MGVPRASRPASEQARTAKSPHHPRDPRRGVLRAQERLSLEAAAPRLPAVGNRLLLVQDVAYRRDVGEVERRAARATARQPGQGGPPERGHRGFAVGQDHRGGRGGAGIRRRQEGPRSQEAPARGHRGSGVGSQGSQRQGARRGRHQAAARARTGPPTASFSLVGGRRLQGHRGKRWAEEVVGLSVGVVRKPPRPVTEKVAKVWAREWAKEGKQIDWQSLMPPRGYVALPRRWVVERTFSWLSQNRRISKDYERLCASAEAFVYAAMIWLMVRRLARA